VIPPKLVKKILALEYVDMAELLAEHYNSHEESESPCCSHSSKSSRRTPVSNIVVWLDCYASLVAVLSSAHPEKFNQFMMYQKTIILAYQRFAGDGWVVYDSSYRRQAANTKFLDWGQMDGRLWNEIFTGRAKAIARCKICLSELHSHTDCPQALTTRLPPSHFPDRQFRREARQTPGEICHLFNDQRGNRCTYHPCKFVHVCAECWGNHPISHCKRDHPYPAKGTHRRH